LMGRHCGMKPTGRLRRRVNIGWKIVQLGPIASPSSSRGRFVYGPRTVRGRGRLPQLAALARSRRGHSRIVLAALAIISPAPAVKREAEEDW
jgi:hypothetical protein